MFMLRTLSKKGTRSALLGKAYDIAVKATKQVSPIISGFDYKNFVSIYAAISYVF
jgi:hypothetical protein